MEQAAIPVPEGRPLCAGGHLVIGEDRAYIGDGVLEDRRGGKVVEIRAVACELQLAEYRVRIWCDLALEQDFDGRWDEGRRRNRCRVSNGWRFRNSRAECDRRGKRDRGTEGNARRYGDGRRRWKVPVGDWLAIAVQDKSKACQQKGNEDGKQPGFLALAADTVKRQSPRRYPGAVPGAKDQQRSDYR